jgi:hypothetical protein
MDQKGNARLNIEFIAKMKDKPSNILVENLGSWFKEP